ncbi:MAG TPA: arginyltransferase [Chroococcales cyanobacterium]
MEVLYKYVMKPTPCHYLPDRQWQLEYHEVAAMTREELLALIEQGWRRMGHTLFRPACSNCTACQPIRILVDQFEPNRNQRRVLKANSDVVVRIGEPVLAIDRIDLYVRHHMHHSEQKGWSKTSPRTAAASIVHFMQTPTPIEEWSYYRGDTLVAISYVDPLPTGFSGVYFYHHPEFRKQSLGIFIVLSLIQRARELGLPYVYLGYFVKGCRSMDYKGRFLPAETMSPDGSWIQFSGARDE